MIRGLVLAAGAGRRFGGPKALVPHLNSNTWVQHAIGTLHAGGIKNVSVVVGAQSAQVRDVVNDSAEIVFNPAWTLGMGTSLAVGLDSVAASDANAVVVTLVDFPTMPSSVLNRLLDQPVNHTTLRRMTYAGIPGHPVLIGREHWPRLLESLTGDRGAQRYLDDHGVVEVAGDDLWDGADQDFRDQA